MKNLIAILVLLFSFQLSAQITGIVTNKNNEPLPYVNIYTADEKYGTTTTDEGYFNLNIPENRDYTLVFQFIGFKKQEIKISKNELPIKLKVKMEEQNVSLKEVVINSKENPAIRIIKNAIKNRKKNSKKIKKYTLEYYSKSVFRLNSLPLSFLEKPEDSTRFHKTMDSIGLGLGIIYLSETVSDVSYQAPGKIKEVMKATKVSGDNKGISFNRASVKQFNFYKNSVEIMKPIISPIASNAFANYKYKLAGTFYDKDGFLVNKIEVIPRRKNDPVFFGYIYILEDSWSIYGVDLNVTGKSIQMEFADLVNIKQNFSFNEKENHWIRKSSFINFDFSYIGIKFDAKISEAFKNYDFNPNFDKKTFTNEVFRVEETALDKDSTYWKNNRQIALEQEQIEDYRKKDSIQKLKSSKKYIDSLDRENNKLTMMKAYMGYTYQNTPKNWKLQVDGLLVGSSFNTVQGFNLTTGLTYKKLNPEEDTYYKIGGKVMQDFSGGRTRFRGNFTKKFKSLANSKLTLEGGNTVTQFNQEQPILPGLNSIYSVYFKRNYLKIYDNTFAKIKYSGELFNGLNIKSSLLYTRRKQLFNTSSLNWSKSDRKYTSNNPWAPGDFTSTLFDTNSIFKFNTEFTINFGQKYMMYPNKKVNLPTKFPVLKVGYEKGFGASKKEYEYDKIFTSLNQTILLGNKGKFKYEARAGKFFNAENISVLDYQYFNGNETIFSQKTRLFNSFNLLPYYDFISNSEYASIHVRHDFKSYILGKIPLINKLNFNLVVGGDVLFTKENKPYAEYSIGLSNVGIGIFRVFTVDYSRSFFNGQTRDKFLVGLSIDLNSYLTKE
ncbi:DUF5686 and carboxypeptidase regulatory-like domain-containing protein [Aureivirga sp. CE67]|uniref:DUF5686 and carboxypeptidase regulatory-like domain-containing protein n=1 Tax=Aureivirga sp. CE67 TaxID=1788983 RepID=UPI0018CA8292|nr:DUF5686 and carboxypeptidase regulatory-like domain-containing protein [Aureivirga sp. CE67]